MQLRNSNGDVDPTSVGYEYTIKTTSFLRTKTIDQKFYKVPIADFMTVEVGQGAWMENIVQNLTYDASGDFESGVINSASTQPDVPEVDTAVSPMTIPVVTWAKGYRYAIPELEKALAANNWDVVKSKTDALKRNWDLGIQRVAFLGSKSNPDITGLLNNGEVTIDTTNLTSNISELAVDEFVNFVKVVLGLFWTNSNATAMPNRFVIPQDDFLGLGVPVSSAFPMVTKLEYLEKTFKQLSGNKDFQILPLAYAQKAYNIGATVTLGSQRYCLYNNDPETVRLDIPVDFNLTNPGTQDNFYWSGKGYGQFTGAVVYRPREMYYFDHTTGA